MHDRQESGGAGRERVLDRCEIFVLWSDRVREHPAGAERLVKQLVDGLLPDEGKVCPLIPGSAWPIPMLVELVDLMCRDQSVGETGEDETALARKLRSDGER